MSRKMFAVAAFALMAPIAIAQAQLKFGVGAGASIPSGDLSGDDGLSTGYHLMATAGIQPPLAPVGFRVDGMFNEFNFKSTLASDLKFRIMGLSANAVLSMPGAVVLSPYAIGGVGMYNSKSTADGDEASTDMGVNIGAGVKFGLAGFGAFAEARFHHIFAEEVAGTTPKIRFIPITFGITF
jgi:hypothetical protein